MKSLEECLTHSMPHICLLPSPCHHHHCLPFCWGGVVIWLGRVVEGIWWSDSSFSLPVFCFQPILSLPPLEVPGTNDSWTFPRFRDWVASLLLEVHISTSFSLFTPQPSTMCCSSSKVLSLSLIARCLSSCSLCPRGFKLFKNSPASILVGFQEEKESAWYSQIYFSKTKSCSLLFFTLGEGAYGNLLYYFSVFF